MSDPRLIETTTSRMTRCLSLLKCSVLTFNVLLWIAGAFLMGLGILIVYDPAAADFFSLYEANQNSFRAVGWMVFAAGAIMVFTGFCGCCGVWKSNKCCLFAFFLILLVAFAIELSAAVLANTKQEKIRDYVEGSMFEAIRTRYASDAAYKNAVDKIQFEMQCCGVRSYKDWLEASWENNKDTTDGTESGRPEYGIGAVGGLIPGKEHGRVPKSCCNEYGLHQYPANCGVSFNQAPLDSYSEFLNTKGCSDVLYDTIYKHLDYVIGACIVIGIFQLIAMVLAIALCCCYDNDPRKEYEY